MDEPGLDAGLHRHALRALERINLVSGNARILWRPIVHLAAASKQPLRLLDLACGAGDVPIRLWRKARKAGLNMAIAGCDVSGVAVGHAQERAQRAGAGVSFFQCDALGGGIPTDYDVVTCSLFLHHLDDDPAVHLLGAMRRAARRAVLVNDLERSRLGWWLAWLGTRVLSSSRVARVDGPRSVEGAYTVEEARALAERAGLTGSTVWRCWPCRFLLAWVRK
jgi:ubiquinone/menaquinone biosynthesis C-methylase UbiE